VADDTIHTVRVEHNLEDYGNLLDSINKKWDEHNAKVRRANSLFKYYANISGTGGTAASGVAAGGGGVIGGGGGGGLGAAGTAGTGGTMSGLMRHYQIMNYQYQQVFINYAKAATPVLRTMGGGGGFAGGILGMFRSGLGLVGASGGALAVEKLISDAAKTTRAASGVASTYGGYKAFNVGYGQLTDTAQLMSKIGSAANVTDPNYVPLNILGLGGRKELNKDTSARTNDAMRAVSEWVKAQKAAGLDRGQMLVAAQARGFDTLFGEETLNRLYSMSPKMLDWMSKYTKSIEKQVTLTQDQQDGYIKLTTQLEGTTEIIKTQFERALIDASPIILKFAGAVSQFVTDSVDSLKVAEEIYEGFKKMYPDIGKWLESPWHREGVGPDIVPPSKQNFTDPGPGGVKDDKGNWIVPPDPNRVPKDNPSSWGSPFGSIIPSAKAGELPPPEMGVGSGGGGGKYGPLSIPGGAPIAIPGGIRANPALPRGAPDLPKGAPALPRGASTGGGESNTINTDAPMLSQLPGNMSWGDYGTRANNPGNMDWAPWEGAASKFPYVDKREGRRHIMAVFKTMPEGVAAAYKLLVRNQARYGKTLAGALHGWASIPYTTKLGINPNAAFDVTTADPELLGKIMGAQYGIEGGHPGSHHVTREQIMAGINLGRGKGIAADKVAAMSDDKIAAAFAGPHRPVTRTPLTRDEAKAGLAQLIKSGQFYGTEEWETKKKYGALSDAINKEGGWDKEQFDAAKKQPWGNLNPYKDRPAGRYGPLRYGEPGYKAQEQDVRLHMNNMSHFQGANKQYAIRIDNQAGANYAIQGGMLGTSPGNYGVG
jgi:hypothetical protein